MKSDERIIEILQAARALVAQGWCQHVNEIVEPDGHKCYCSIGSLMALRTDQSYFYAADLLARAISPELWHKRGSITNWNDHPERTQEDVLAAFDRAIASVAMRMKEFPSEI